MYIDIMIHWQVRKFVERAREKELLLKRVNLINIHTYIHTYIHAIYIICMHHVCERELQ